jgi:shikimate dehydrogenase
LLTTQEIHNPKGLDASPGGAIHPKSVITGTTRVVGVCGHGISYTLSPAMHNAAFQACGLDYVYVTFEVAPGSAQAAVEGIRSLGLAGVNVTKPLKTEMLPYLDDLTEEARRIGSVNTIINQEGRLIGASTDGIGLSHALETWGVSVSGSHVLILGAGGAARAACAMVFQAKAVSTVIAARNKQRAEETASVGNATTVSFEPQEIKDAIQAADLIINAVPTDLPLNPSWFTVNQAVYDTRYDTGDTILMHSARSQGAQVSNGLDMLLFQGAASFELWTDQEAPIEVMRAALEKGLGKR